MKFSIGPRQLIITLTPNQIGGAKLAADARLLGAETDDDYARLARQNRIEVERARNAVTGFFSGSRLG